MKLNEIAELVGLRMQITLEECLKGYRIYPSKYQKSSVSKLS